MAFHGPTADHAMKVVVDFMRDDGLEPDPLRRRSPEETAVRDNPEVAEEAVAFLKGHAAKAAIVADGLIGSPHEKGIDNPEGNPAPALLRGSNGALS